jgi:microcystin synthetase protein McyD
MNVEEQKSVSGHEKSTQTRVFKALQEANARLKAVEAQASEPIAIVGLGCRFGSNITTPDSFWSFLQAGQTTIQELPNDRWNKADFYNGDRHQVGKIYVSQGGFLDDVASFDPHFFGIAPKEALTMDPQQRLLLEVAYEALENAGMAAPTARTGKTGVFIGITSNDYSRLIAPDEDYQGIGAYHISGNHANAAAGRLSYLLNLNGPSLAIDTACSSSLVAVHLACRSLRSLECRQALVGGVNLILTPEVPIALCRNQMLAADGQCKTFDARADGFGMGEGCGIVVLKRLSEALTDGDRIWGLIRGTAVNNDGASGGFTVPNGTIQTELIRDALQDARLAPDVIDYVEAHGTGTSLGDPIEIKAIAEALGANRSQPLLVGSVKTNLGHLAAAAGISGLIKTVLALYYSEIPPHLNFQTPNPYIDWDRLPIKVVSQNRPWEVKTEKIKAAGVSSFGASGTNAHVILSEPPQPPAIVRKNEPILVTLSAKDSDRLALFAAQLAHYLTEKPELKIQDIAFSLNTGRFSHKQRLALLVSNLDDLKIGLKTFLDQNKNDSTNNSISKKIGSKPYARLLTGVAQSNPKIAFLCRDQDNLPLETIRELLNNQPVFQTMFKQCCRLLEKDLTFSLETLLFSPQTQATDLENNLLIQSFLTFAYHYALCELWKSWGIRPSAILGSGLGEYLAAQQAGVLSLETALKFVETHALIIQAPGDRQALAQLQILARETPDNAPQLTLILAGKVVDTPTLSRDYWQQIPSASPLVQNTTKLQQMGYQIFLEIGTYSPVIDLGEQTLTDSEILGLDKLVATKNYDTQIQQQLAELYIRGISIDWQAFHRSHPGRKISLPSSPFLRKRYWVSPPHPVPKSPQLSLDQGSGHPLLGDRLSSPLADQQYRSSISQNQPAFLADHRVFGQVIFPGSAFIEMALAATKNRTVRLEKIEFKKALLLQEKLENLQFILTQSTFQIYQQIEQDWEELVTGEIASLTYPKTTLKNLAQIQANCPEVINISAFYQTYQQAGVDYGQTFKLITQLQRGENIAFAHIQLTDDLRLGATQYRLHPAMLDNCFQVIAAILFQQESSTTYVPIRVTQFELFQTPPETLVAVARIQSHSVNIGLVIADLEIYSLEGKLISVLMGLELKAVQGREIFPSAKEPQIYGEDWIVLPSPLTNGRDYLLSPKTIKAQIKPTELEEKLGATLQEYEALLSAMEALSVTYIWEALKKLHWQPQSGQIYTENDIANQGQVVDFYRPLLSRCLAILAEENIVTKQSEGWLFNQTPIGSKAETLIQSLRQQFPDYGVEINLMERCGSALAAVLRRQEEPLELLFPQGNTEVIAALYREASGAKLMNQLVATAVQIALKDLPNNRSLRILEIGGGTGAVTNAILPLLPATQIEYVFTDISTHFLTRAQENFGDYPFVSYQILDIEKNPVSQNFLLGSFDLIIAANVLHATTDMQITMKNGRSLIAPQGLLILLESTGARRWVDLTFGLTEGWWLCSQDRLRGGYPLLATEQWQQLLTQHHFQDIHWIEPSQTSTRNQLKQTVILAQNSDREVCLRQRVPSSPSATAQTLIFADSQGIANSLTTLLNQRAIAYTAVFSDILQDNPENHRSILETYFTPEIRQVIYFWGLEASAGEIYETVERNCQRFLQVLQTLLQQEHPPALVLITQGAVPAKTRTTLINPAQAPLLGIALSFVLEHPDILCRSLDLDPNAIDLADLGATLFQEIYYPSPETRLALRDQQRFVPRLAKQTLETDQLCLREDGYYLITGGTGGLGLATAQWLIAKGARHLVLCSRQGSKALPAETFAALQSEGIEIKIKAVDVTHVKSLEDILEECRGQYPIRGIFHIAGTLDDTTLLQLTPERLNYVLAPKVKGTWLLHHLTLNDPLDFFVCYTSAVSLIGSAGQGNAAAANAFEDAFICDRHNQGLPGTAINWGPWAEIGAAVDRQVLERLAAKGFNGMKSNLALDSLEKILVNQVIRAGVFEVDWQRFPYLEQPFYENFSGQRLERQSEVNSHNGQTQWGPTEWQTLPQSQRRNWLIHRVSESVSQVLGRSPDEPISPSQGFFDLGMDSLTSTELRNLLQTDFTCSLPSTITFRFPTVEALADYLLTEVLDKTPFPHSSPSLPIPLSPYLSPSLPIPPSPQTQLTEDPIVIVGMGCRFPGEAKNLQAFWELLEQGREAVSEIKPDRWDQATWYDADPNAIGKIYAPYGAFLEDIDQFDADFFGIIPREAIAMDPQQRLLLETTWEALENAGQNPQQLYNSQTGVFIGCMTQDYAQLSYAPHTINAYTGSGVSVSVASGRLSYVLGLQGPSMTVDTACSSSLVAVHLAYNALRNGECDLAIAGGVNVILTPVISLIESRAQMLSPDGHCKTFDDSADGMVRGEGCGVIVLKRLSQALKQGDNILAQIYGTAVNHDGPSSGLTVPNGQAQEKLLAQTLKTAQLNPEQIDYIEAHGTGTALGDPIELESMAAIFGTRPAQQPLVIGSVKTNLGHLEGAAGIAGLIKTVLALQHEKIPPHLHFKTPNSRFDWHSGIFEVPVQGKSWTIGDRPRIAGVSSFGFSGTNAHILLGDGTVSSHNPSKIEELGESSDNSISLFPLSTRSEKSLHALANRYQSVLNNSLKLEDVCLTVSTGRGNFDNRLCILADSINTIQQGLNHFEKSDEFENLITPNPHLNPENSLKVVFLFSGQGSQYSGMGASLYQQEPVFQETLNLCSQILEPILGESLLDLIFAAHNRERLNQTALTQPVLFAFEYALAKLWQSWGVEPAALLGHSIGEYVAACLAGVFSLKEALNLVSQRGRLMGELPQNGLMTAIYADENTVDTELNLLNNTENKINIAAANGAITVISGVSETVEQLEKILIEKGYKAKRLAVSHAFHSPLMEPILADFAQVLAGISFQKPHITIISNLTGQSIGQEIATPEYWVKHLRSTVRFGQGFKTLIEQGYRCFLEISSKPVLLGMARQMSPPPDCLWLPSIVLGQAEKTQMYKSLATLFVNGYSLAWNKILTTGKRIALPTYPFERDRYWLSDTAFPGTAIKKSLHPFINDFKKLATAEIVFEGQISSNNPDYLAEHQVFDKVLLPATAFIETILAASQTLLNSDRMIIENVAIQQGLLLSQKLVTLQLIFKPQKSDQQQYHFEVFSQNATTEQWILHLVGDVKVNTIQEVITPTLPKINREVEKTSVSIPEFYALYQKMGIAYGKLFQGIQELYALDQGCLAKMSLHPSLKDSRYCFHPVLLDACFQSIGAAFGEIHGQELHLPYGFSRLELFQQPTETVWTEVKIKAEIDGEMRVDVNIYDQQEQLCARFTDLVARRTRPEILQKFWQTTEKKWFYQIEWQKLTTTSTIAEKNQRSWLVFVHPQTTLKPLIELLKNAGKKVTVITLSDHYHQYSQADFAINFAQKSDFERIFQEAYSSENLPTDIIFSWDNQSEKKETDIVYNSFQAVLNLIQTLTDNRKVLPNLCLITRGANQVFKTDILQPQYAHLSGLAAVINQEYSNLRCVCLDLDCSNDPNEAEAIFDQLHTISDELRLALRHGDRYGSRLIPGNLPGAKKQTFINSEATYLITGGLGKLGQLLAQWLSQMGAKHIVLCSRSDKNSSALIAKIVDQGTEISIIKTDITSALEMEELFARFGRDLPPLGGVIQAAAVLEDGLIANQNWHQCQKALEAKIEGTLLLNHHTRHLNLNFFISFSSAAVILGSPGQSNYVAANAFMDALMLQRQTLGLPSLTINWGAWDTGNSLEKERFAQWGLHTMAADSALSYLKTLILNEITQGIVLDINWSNFNQAFNIEQPFFKEVLTSKNQQKTSPAKLGEILKSVPLNERINVLAQGIEKILRDITGLSTKKVIPHKTSFLDLGLNSLMVIEFKNRLELDLNRTLPSSIIFDYPTIAVLSTYLRTEILGSDLDFETKDNAPSESVNPYADLNEEELATLLSQKLREFD